MKYELTEKAKNLPAIIIYTEMKRGSETKSLYDDFDKYSPDIESVANYIFSKIEFNDKKYTEERRRNMYALVKLLFPTNNYDPNLPLSYTPLSKEQIHEIIRAEIFFGLASYTPEEFYRSLSGQRLGDLHWAIDEFDLIVNPFLCEGCEEDLSDDYGKVPYPFCPWCGHEHKKEYPGNGTFIGWDDRFEA